MAIEERVKSMEDELRLLKGELRQTLVNVREFLLDLKLPGPPEIVEADTTISRGGGRPEPGLMAAMPAPSLASRPSPEMARRPVEDPQAPAPSPEPAEPAMPDLAVHQSHAHVQRRPVAEGPAPAMQAPSPRMAQAPGEPGPIVNPAEFRIEPPAIEPPAPPESPRKAEPRNSSEQETREMPKEVTSSPVPQVNLLSNLIRWVSSARKQVGGQLPILLDVYAVSGNLSPELKEVILHMAEVAGDKSAPEATGDGDSEVWSKLMLELHGILTGGGTPLRLVDVFGKHGPKNQQSGATPESGSTKAGENPQVAQRPARLKLVLPANGEGEKEFNLAEFSIDLGGKASREKE